MESAGGGAAWAQPGRDGRGRLPGKSAKVELRARAEITCTTSTHSCHPEGAGTEAQLWSATEGSPVRQADSSVADQSRPCCAVCPVPVRCPLSQNDTTLPQVISARALKRGAHSDPKIAATPLPRGKPLPGFAKNSCFFGRGPLICLTSLPR